ncbi:MAG: ATP-binding protein [Candidatus Binatia bacterium]|nr:ATP-binding protein [Candidatus Binatia bacterium]
MKKAVSDFLKLQWLNVLESIDEAMIVVDQGGAVEFMNEAAAILTGHSASLAIGTAASGLLRENQWLVDLLQSHSAPTDNAVHIDGTVVDRLHHKVPVHASATLLRQEDGTRVGTLLTLQDLTHQRELEARAREVDRLGELETLVAGLAHEIRNPLSGMRGAAQLLSGEPGAGERVTECTAIMVEEIDRLEGLMSQLLELSGPPRALQVSVNIHKLLDHVVTIEAAGGTDKARFTRRFDPSLPPVLGNPARLTQVLLNLIRNAGEATAASGSITLTTRMETTYRVAGAGHRGRFLAIEISDEGPGISEADLDRIFSPFFTTKSRGTGLGLAISQRIVSEHGGVLRARSTVGHGATFTLTLPVDPGTNHGE